MDNFNRIFDERITSHFINSIYRDVYECLMYAKMDKGINLPLATYLAFKVCEVELPTNVTFETVVDEILVVEKNVKNLLKKRFSENFWENMAVKVIPRYPAEFFRIATIHFIENDDNKIFGSTPVTVLKLVHKMLSVNNDELVADVCCGSGSFFINAVNKEKNAKYFGYDINEENILMVRILSELLGVDIDVAACDVFSLAAKGNKFNKIFSNYPFGLKIKNLGEGAQYFKKLSTIQADLSKATSSDWIFNSLLCDLLTENGKAVGIMTNGSTWNTIDIPMRKYFIEKKMVECVISLPNRMFSSTTIPTTIIVLSHNNESVRMIDASKICQQGRRQNELSDDNIETIINALSNDTEFSKTITLQELRENEYVLNLGRYVKDDSPFENGVLFESIIKSITRGAPCTASQLDELVSDRVTNMQYLMLGNIQNGMIDDKLPYISSIDPKYEKYCLKNNSLILSKNGYPYKIAIANVKEEQRILANGNLYIIELDEGKTNPYYIKSFLESEYGNVALKEITVGATIPNIGVDKLKKIVIPLPSIEEQNRIAQKYKETLDEIEILKSKLEETTQKLSKIFDYKNC